MFLDVSGSAPHEYSEETARTIDEEIEKILADAHDRVRATLAARRPVLESLAKLLIDKEVVDADALRKLLGA